MKRFTPTFKAFIFCLTLHLLSNPVSAQTLKIPEIPAGWPIEVRNTLQQHRDTVIKHSHEYDQRVLNFNARCAGTISPDNTSLISYCQQESTAIDIQSDAVDREKEQFITEFHDTEKSFGSGDPNVVDARNVPSGLPKTVEDALAKEYKNDPPEVTDRVRKAFQAIQTRDWKVAKAWFQDALFRDPGNKGLENLIKLCDYTINYKPPTTNVSPGKISYDQLSTQEKNLLNVWIKRVRESDKNGIIKSEVDDFPQPALDHLRKYVYGLSRDERENMLFPIDYMIDLILYDMMK